MLWLHWLLHPRHLEDGEHAHARGQLGEVDLLVAVDGAEVRAGDALARASAREERDALVVRRLLVAAQGSRTLDWLPCYMV